MISPFGPHLHRAIKSTVPDVILRKALSLLPRRWVVRYDELGFSLCFAVYPRDGGDFKLLFRHETEARKELAHCVALGDVVLDIGAHHGLYTLLLSRLVGEGGRVHAFEPHPSNVGKLRENIELNGMANVLVNEVAVSKSRGVSRFNYGNSSTVSSLKELSKQRDDWHEVETVSVDEYVRAAGVGRVSFVKIDVEGAEDWVLSGMELMLARDCPTLLLEFHSFAFGDDARAAAMFDDLFDRRAYTGQVLYVMDVGKYRPAQQHPHVSSYRDLATVTVGAHVVGVLLRPPTGCARGDRLC
jgi:FkbM family methyltransferase